MRQFVVSVVVVHATKHERRRRRRYVVQRLLSTRDHQDTAISGVLRRVQHRHCRPARQFALIPCLSLHQAQVKRCVDNTQNKHALFYLFVCLYLFVNNQTQSGEHAASGAGCRRQLLSTLAAHGTCEALRRALVRLQVARVQARRLRHVRLVVHVHLVHI